MNKVRRYNAPRHPMIPVMQGVVSVLRRQGKHLGAAMAQQHLRDLHNGEELDPHARASVDRIGRKESPLAALTRHYRTIDNNNARGTSTWASEWADPPAEGEAPPERMGRLRAAAVMRYALAPYATTAKKVVSRNPGGDKWTRPNPNYGKELPPGVQKDTLTARLPVGGNPELHPSLHGTNLAVILHEIKDRFGGHDKELDRLADMGMRGSAPEVYVKIRDRLNRIGAGGSPRAVSTAGDKTAVLDYAAPLPRDLASRAKELATNYNWHRVSSALTVDKILHGFLADHAEHLASRYETRAKTNSPDRDSSRIATGNTPTVSRVAGKTAHTLRTWIANGSVARGFHNFFGYGSVNRSPTTKDAQKDFFKAVRAHLGAVARRHGLVKADITDDMIARSIRRLGEAEERNDALATKGPKAQAKTDSYYTTDPANRGRGKGLESIGRSNQYARLRNEFYRYGLGLPEGFGKKIVKLPGKVAKGIAGAPGRITRNILGALGGWEDDHEPVSGIEHTSTPGGRFNPAAHEAAKAEYGAMLGHLHSAGRIPERRPDEDDGAYRQRVREAVVTQMKQARDFARAHPDDEDVRSYTQAARGLGKGIGALGGVSSRSDRGNESRPKDTPMARMMTALFPLTRKAREFAQSTRDATFTRENREAQANRTPAFVGDEPEGIPDGSEDTTYARLHDLLDLADVPEVNDLREHSPEVAHDPEHIGAAIYHGRRYPIEPEETEEDFATTPGGGGGSGGASASPEDDSLDLPPDEPEEEPYTPSEEYTPPSPGTPAPEESPHPGGSEEPSWPEESDWPGKEENAPESTHPSALLSGPVTRENFFAPLPKKPRKVTPRMTLQQLGHMYQDLSDHFTMPGTDDVSALGMLRGVHGVSPDQARRALRLYRALPARPPGVSPIPHGMGPGSTGGTAPPTAGGGNSTYVFRRAQAALVRRYTSAFSGPTRTTGTVALNGSAQKGGQFAVSPKTQSSLDRANAKVAARARAKRALAGWK